MNLIPTQEEIVNLLYQTGGLRDGHFVYPDGLHVDKYLQVPLTMQHYNHAKMLSVALSRLVRADKEIKPLIPELSIVAPATGGLPVAYGMCESLRAKKVYWAERDNENQPQRFRQYMEVTPGERVLLVDDILRSGRKLTELRDLVISKGGIVVGLAVIVYQPTPNTASFGDLPFFYLAKLDATYLPETDASRIPGRAERVWI
jgi:orotate phosphoribosyltransferase